MGDELASKVRAKKKKEKRAHLNATTKHAALVTDFCVGTRTNLRGITLLNHRHHKGTCNASMVQVSFLILPILAAKTQALQPSQFNNRNPLL